MIALWVVHAVSALLDRPPVRISAIAELFRAGERGDAERADVATLVALGAHLPSGLVHAEAVVVVRDPPPGLAPLSRRSPWFAEGRTLFVVAPPGRAARFALIQALATYAHVATRVAARLDGRPRLVEALAADAEPGPALVTELALALDSPPALIAALDRRAPGLRRDLAEMAAGRFDPDLRVEPALRAPPRAESGLSAARALLGELPQGVFRLAVADSPLLLEHLSPYVRDLAGALFAWGLENAASLSIPDLEPALAEHADPPHPDLAALVVSDLFRAAPDLLEERRAAERAAGLHVTDGDGLVTAWTDVSRLSRPDDLAVPRGATGTLAVLVGPADEALLEAAGALLETGRVESLSVALAAGIDLHEPIIPDALVTESDGIRVGRGAEVTDWAAQNRLSVHRTGALLVDDVRGAPSIAAELLMRSRRTFVVGRSGEAASGPLVLYPSAKHGNHSSLERALAEVEAVRIALSAHFVGDDPLFGRRQRQVLSQNAPGLSRRFRA